MLPEANKLMNNNDVEKALSKAISYYGLKVQAFLQQGKYPTGQDPHRKEYKPIENTKEILPAVISQDEIRRRIQFGDEDTAPYAAAFEFGSGKQSIKSPGTYRIEPKEEITVIKYPGQRGKRAFLVKEKALAVGSGPKLRGRGGWFPTNEAGVAASPKSVKKSFRNGVPQLSKPDKHVYEFYYVDHPGIKARPFAETVWLNEQEKIMQTFGLDLYSVIVADLEDLLT